MSSRRDFLTTCGKVISGAALSSALLPILQACQPSSLPFTPTSNNTGADGRVAVDVSDLSDAQPIKIAPGITGSDNLPVLITRLSVSDYRALSSKCTHSGCQVESSLRNGKIPCLCHGSQFGLDGSVKQGPASEPLHEYDATYDPSTNTLHILIA